MYALVIPSGSLHNLLQCLNNIITLEPDLHNIVIVGDDINMDKIPLGVEKLEGEKPFIFARNVNAGIQHAIDQFDAEGVIVMGDDGMLLEPLGLTYLMRVGREFPEYGVIAGGTNNCGNPAQRWKTRDALREVESVAFICVFISRQCIDTVGLMDEQFTGYGYDDDDYCKRARDAGFKVGVYDGCKINHMALPSVFRKNGPPDIAINRTKYDAKWNTEDAE